MKQKLKEKEKDQETQIKILNETYKNYAQKLKEFFSIDVLALKNEIKDKEKQEAEFTLNRFFQDKLEQFQENVERDAIRILNQAIDRFPQAYCPERGFSIIALKNKKDFKKVIGPHRNFLNFLEKQCGVDVVVDEENFSFSVQGLDPVRREWGRMSLEKLSKKKNIHTSLIKSITQNTKRELFKKIRKDGLKICQRLKLKKYSY